jgi:hypothetical protein
MFYIDVYWLQGMDVQEMRRIREEEGIQLRQVRIVPYVAGIASLFLFVLH